MHGVRMEKEGCSCCDANGGAGRVWQSIGGALYAHKVSSYLHCFPPHPAVELDVSQALSNIPERLDSRSSLYKSLLELMPQGGQKGSWQVAGSDEGRARIRIHAPTSGCSLDRKRSVLAALPWVPCIFFTPTPQIFETCDFREPQLGAIPPTNVFSSIISLCYFHLTLSSANLLVYYPCVWWSFGLILSLLPTDPATKTTRVQT